LFTFRISWDFLYNYLNLLQIVAVYCMLGDETESC